MNVRKIINKRIRRSGGGTNVVGDINAVISGSIGERAAYNSVSSSQRIVQRSGRTDVAESDGEAPRSPKP